MSKLKNKIDFAALLSVTMANPNGDPLDGNRPRVDLDSYGEISDVCIKRKLRNRMQDLGEAVFVQSADRCDDGCGSLSERAQGLFQELGAQKAKEDACAAAACEKWLDVRSFGQVFAFKGKGGKKEEGEDGKGVSIPVRGPGFDSSGGQPFAGRRPLHTDYQERQRRTVRGKKLRHDGQQAFRPVRAVSAQGLDQRAACRKDGLFRRGRRNAQGMPAHVVRERRFGRPSRKGRWKYTSCTGGSTTAPAGSIPRQRSTARCGSRPRTACGSRRARTTTSSRSRAFRIWSPK